MKIYNYAANGEFIGQSLADESPLEPNVWLIPAYATTIAPPSTPVGKVAVFISGAWVLAEDHRGKAGWVNGVRATISELGPLPNGWSDAPPIPTMDEAQASKLTEIIAGSNRAAAYLKSFYSEAEEESWPQQEAGARSILKQDANVKDDTAASILRDPVRTEAAVNLVKTLAQIDEVSAESFSSRIVDNAEKAYGAKILTLTEQRGFEHALKDAAATGQVETVQALVIKYSLPPDGVQL